MNKEEITFDNVFTFENLWECGLECLKGVRWKHSAQTFEVFMLGWITNLHRDLYEGKYKSKGFNNFELTERGKVRKIQSVHISERVVQKCLVRYALRPLMVPTLIYDNGASLEGKGTDFAIKRLKKHMSTHWRKYRDKGGILLIDFKNYFGSIPHDRINKMFDYYIKDERINKLSKYFVNCFEDPGLGLGSEISQIAAITYLNPFDHYIKEKLHIKGYGRYMDDAYLISDDIQYLWECFDKLKKMAADYGLELNQKSRIHKFADGSFTFLKKRVRFSDTGKVVVRVSKQSIRRERVKLKKLKKKGLSQKEAMPSITSFYKFARKYDSKWAARQMVDLFIQLWPEGWVNNYPPFDEKSYPETVKEVKELNGTRNGERAGQYKRVHTGHGKKAQ